MAASVSRCASKILLHLRRTGYELVHIFLGQDTSVLGGITTGYLVSTFQLALGIFVPWDVCVAWPTNSSLETHPSTMAKYSGPLHEITITSEEQTPSTGATPTLWKYGLIFPKRI